MSYETEREDRRGIVIGMHEINVESYERTINDILSGLIMYVRDVDLEPTLTGKHKPSMVIMEKGFTDNEAKEHMRTMEFLDLEMMIIQMI